MIHNNFIALLITFAVALAWLRVNDFAAHRGWISSHLSRKIIHMGTGPLFVLCWPLFTDNAASRYLAALVPLAITIQFILVGLGVMRDPSAVQAMTRTGNPREILRGPLYYGLVFIVLTILYWYDSPTGMVGLMMMCGGDGLADILGRRFGKTPLPWSPKKSWIGSLGMFLGGWSFALGVILAFILIRIFPGHFSDYLLPVTLIAITATLIESLPFQDIDNITVPMVAILIGPIFW
jgi:phytol kinase